MDGDKLLNTFREQSGQAREQRLEKEEAERRGAACIDRFTAIGNEFRRFIEVSTGRKTVISPTTASPVIVVERVQDEEFGSGVLVAQVNALSAALEPVDRKWGKNFTVSFSFTLRPGYVSQRQLDEERFVANPPEGHEEETPLYLCSEGSWTMTAVEAAEVRLGAMEVTAGQTLEYLISQASSLDLNPELASRMQAAYPPAA